ncbi:right-handed parallel beta-helix repeat-containing protein [Archangium violaceum]|uniref:right-handed parallel beta-helix repeat-containing protein n=1 Tax=Archangium violaceum TaxID=83451 RepID=UPI00194FDAD0|nr:right-handed parallel beta-helix repeat-containing protein [Archangium violaceum]QRN97793.1 right-handed parallel beta-helix repeat-containing protein [Archangium violaceum]
MMKRAWTWVGLTALLATLGGCSHVEKVNDKLEGIADGLSDVTTGVKEINGTFQGKVFTEEETPATEEQPAEQPLPEPTDSLKEWVKPEEVPPVEDTVGPQSKAPSNTYSREWYVSPSGSDSAAGSRDAPFRTISRAVKAVSPGELIRVQAGEYAESVVIDGNVRAGTAKAPILLKGERMPRLVPGKASGALVQVRKPHWRIEGFEVDVRRQPRFAVLFAGNTEGSSLAHSHLHDGKLGGGVTTHGGARGVTIERNHIHGFRRDPDDSHGVVVQATSRDIVIRDNDIHGNSGDSVQCLKPDNASQEPARGVLIERNHLHENGENAVDIKTCRDVVIRGNRMHGFKLSKTSKGEAVVVHYSASDVRIEDNDIAQAGRGISIGGVKEGPNPLNVMVRGNRIRDIASDGHGTGIRVENARKVQLLQNVIENTDSYGVMVGVGANKDPSEDLIVRNNDIRTGMLVRVGPKRPRLDMDDNRYRAGGLLKADQRVETRDLTRWKQATGLDQKSAYQ